MRPNSSEAELKQAEHKITTEEEREDLTWSLEKQVRSRFQTLMETHRLKLDIMRNITGSDRLEASH